VRQKLQTSRDGPLDLELSNVSDYGSGQQWRVARASNYSAKEVFAGGAFAGVADDFDHRWYSATKAQLIL
jgi:hypothetical protein